MKFWTHFLFSIVCFLGITNIAVYINHPVESHFNLESLLLVLLFLFLGSAMPDIDTSSSKVGRKKWFRPLQKITKHRGFFHSLLAGAIFAFILSFVSPKEYALIFLLGYWLHVVLDGLTPKGVALLWPLPFRMKGRRKIGEMEEWFLDLLFIVLIACFIFPFFH